MLTILLLFALLVWLFFITAFIWIFRGLVTPLIFSFFLMLSLTWLAVISRLQQSSINVPVTTEQTSPFPAWLPDLCWKGYTAIEFNDWFDAIGDQGRSAYKTIILVDLFLNIPSYFMALEFGLLLAHSPLPWLLLPFLAAGCDYVETLIFLGASLWHPKQYTSPLIPQVASVATQAKFIFLLVSAFGIAYNYFVASHIKFILILLSGVAAYFYYVGRRDEGGSTNTYTKTTWTPLTPAKVE